ncbi:MAG TPA: DUF1080 domain-containing protein [Vicinamibacterales bacterium]|nr:DUF1080 domain-containing protein [Vicinamibacterales bacterium]
MRFAVAACLLAGAVVGVAGQSPFVGRWNLTGTGEQADYVYWLEVKEEGGALKGMFLNRGGHPLALQDVKVENGELIFHLAGRDNVAGPEFRGRLQDGQLVGSSVQGTRTISFTGRRSPTWPAANANAKHKFGKPVHLFNGRSLDNWDLQHKTRPSGWTVADGMMSNEAKANNLISRDTFKDFRIDAEYKLEKDSNSGIYLRGRHELQVLDDHGQPPQYRGHMSLYGWTAPTVNASKAPGEWQVMQATVVGNRLSVMLNGQKVHDNETIQAITGGALDADETAAGPIMIQGDHGKVYFRKLIVTPITKVGRK